MSTHPAVYRIEIGLDHADQRIDNFLVTHLKGVPKDHLYRLLRRGEVRVNQGRIKPHYRLQVGDQVRIPPVRHGEEEPSGRPGTRLLSLVEKQILFEDSGLLVLNKPAGLAVHGGSGLRFGVIEILRALRPEVSSLELVHRLDRDTSGLLMLAKRRSILRELHALLRAGEVEKHYLALARGVWSGGTVNAPLLKNHLQSGERVVRVDITGKEATTQFTRLASSKNVSILPATLVDVQPITGRTHQIRVHAVHAGHPIAGDEKYGDPDFNRLARDSFGLQRLFLHAHRLKLAKKGLSWEAPLEESLQLVVKKATGEKYYSKAIVEWL
ncbi:23S rRNA pseudouridine(955/2504/2580) synthase [Gammaproteobacteria bacterium]